MLPLTLLAANKITNLLKTNDSFSNAIGASAAAAGADVPRFPSAQIFLSYIGPEIGDMNLQMTYPRICVYTTQVVNNQTEKFRSFSGFVAVVIDIWSSASLEQPAEVALHFYVEAAVGLLRANIGDLGDGCRYSGIYEVHIQTPKTGALGFVQSARVMCRLDVSLT